MLMSSRIRSGGSRRAASSASLPLGTGRTLYPRSLSMPASTWRLAGVSSTTRMLAGCSAPLFGFPGFTEGSCFRTVDDRTTSPNRSESPCNDSPPRPRGACPPCEDPERLAGYSAAGGRGHSAVGYRFRSVMRFLIVLHFIHEGADEHQAAPAD